MKIRHSRSPSQDVGEIQQAEERDALQGVRLRRQGGLGRDGSAARRRRHLDRDGAGGGAARRARVAVHALPGLPEVARRDPRDPARARPHLGAARQHPRRGRARGAPATGLRRAGDEGSRRAAGGVPAHEPAHVGRRRRVRVDRRRGHARGSARGDRRRDRGRVRPARRVGRARQRDDGADRRHVPDRRLQRGARHGALARGLPHGRRVRLRPDRPRCGARRRGALRRAAVHGAGRRGLAHHPARGRVPPGCRRPPTRKARRRRPQPLDLRGRRLAAPAPRLRPLPRRHAGDGACDRDVVRRDGLAGVRGPEQPARSGARRARDVHPAAPSGAAGRPPGRPLPAPHAARDRDRPRHGDHDRAVRGHAGGSRCDVALLPARVRDGRRIGARGPRRAGPDAVARAAGDPRAGAGLQIRRLPGLGDRRPGDRRSPVRVALRARLRGRSGAVARLARGDPAAARRARACRRLVTRPGERAGRRAPCPADARLARRHLARPVRRPLRRGRCAAAGVREGHPRGRSGRARRAARGAGRRRAVLRARSDAMAGAADMRAAPCSPWSRSTASRSSSSVSPS